jgi:hypothetical protein
MEMGDLETVLGLCPNLIAFRLHSCMHVSSILLQFMADYCPDLEILDLAGCPVSDGYLEMLVKGCPGLRKVNLSETNVGVGKALCVLAKGLGYLEVLELDGVHEDPNFHDGRYPVLLSLFK